MGCLHRQLRELCSLAGGYANCVLRTLAAPRHLCPSSPVLRLEIPIPSFLKKELLTIGKM